MASTDSTPTYPAPFAALLSYLIPGMGQIYQGRIGKGLLFLICIYALFFFGVVLGKGRNVFLPDTAKANNPWNLPNLAANLYNRPQFAGQFWVGVVVWPAVWQYLSYDVNPNVPPPLGGLQRTPSEAELNELQIKSDKSWDLGWVYTVVAGVLNILVIYDAFAGPAFLSVDLTPKPVPEAARS